MKLRQLELAAAGGGQPFEFDGTTPVEVVPSPAAGFVRVVDSVRIANIDTAAVTIRVRVTIAGPTDYEFDSTIALAANGKFDPVDGDHVVRLAEGQSITAVMDAGAATNDPTGVASWIDVPEPV